MNCIGLVLVAFRDSGWLQQARMTWAFPTVESREQSGAAEACWAHNPEVDGSKPSSATFFTFLLVTCLSMFGR